MASDDSMIEVLDDLQKIERALLKIQDGTYGVDDAGNEFSEKQLEANPYAEVALDVE
jgi:RNA polymerase-binding transcription factor DksA